ncbi:hypothetical protein ACFQZE_13705 [Paenibacillus sp. GCM10027627]|uniref:hypothetical protein n=1 Tax=unclassified Paenibacillus TaxID=185978 RepID=UPI003632C3B3
MNQTYIQEAFEQLARDKTVVIIAHRLHTVRRADHIVVIDDGKAVQSGTHMELLASGGIYRRSGRSAAGRKVGSCAERLKRLKFNFA